MKFQLNEVHVVDGKDAVLKLKGKVPKRADCLVSGITPCSDGR
jgi:hypothetical protein